MSSYLDQNGLSRVISKIKDSLNGKLDKSGGTVTGNLAVNGQFTNGGKTIDTIVDEKLTSSGQISMSSTEHIVGYLDSYPIYERTFYGKQTTSTATLVVSCEIGENLIVLEEEGAIAGVPIYMGTQHVVNGNLKGVGLILIQVLPEYY